MDDRSANYLQFWPLFPGGQPGEHNRAVTDGQAAAACPQCGSAAAVHSIQELAALAKGRTGGQPQGTPGAPQQGFGAEPQQGPLPGYAGEPRSGPLPGTQAGRNSGFPRNVGGDIASSIEDDIAGAAVAAATKFIGRAIGRRMQRTFNERVQPALAAKQEAMLREQTAIAERYPGLRACLTDKVVFLAGGSRVLPMAGLTGMITLAQADAAVASLQDG